MGKRGKIPADRAGNLNRIPVDRAGNLNKNPADRAAKLYKALLGRAGKLYKVPFAWGARILLRYLPRALLGNPEVMEKRYGSYYARKDPAARAEEIRLRTAGTYLLILLMFLPLFLAALLPGEEEKADRILRPPSGGEGRTEIRSAEVEFEGARLRKDVAIRVPPVTMTTGEKRQKLMRLGELLPDLIKGENPDLEHVASDLKLPEGEAESGIRIRWVSDHPSVLDEKGQIDSILAMDGVRVTLTAAASIGEMVMEFPFSVNILPGKGGDHTRALEKRLSDAVEKLAHEGGRNAAVALPEELGDGVAVSWKNGGSHPLPGLVLCMVFLFLLAWQNRYGPLIRQRKNDIQSIRADLPDFVHKLILLLNAGLVTESAIRKIVSDYEIHRAAAARPLYEGLREIEKRVSETNSGLVRELRAFASESGVREFMRFTAILADNLNKGSALAEKLGGEAAFLWLERKKRAEELARLAETKLALPLMLELIVVILVTAAPILINL